MRRRAFIVMFGGAAAVWPAVAHAQQRANLPRIAFIGTDTPSQLAQRVQALRDGFRDLGYVDGKNIVFEFRYAEGNYNRLPALVSDLVALHVDLLITQGSPSTIAAKRATTTIPIVMTVVGDALTQGIVSSLSHPGVNITGVSWQTPELSAKRLQLLREVLPHVSKIAVLANPDNSSNAFTLKAMDRAAQSINVELYQQNVRGANELAGAVSTIANKGIHALVIIDDGIMVANAKTLAELAARYRLASVGFWRVCGIWRSTSLRAEPARNVSACSVLCEQNS